MNYLFQRKITKKLVKKIKCYKLREHINHNSNKVEVFINDDQILYFKFIEIINKSFGIY